MLNRQINVLKADGSWGPAGVDVDNFDQHDYVTPVPKTDNDAEKIREQIESDFKANKLAKPNSTFKSHKRRTKSKAVTLIHFNEGKANKELVYRHKQASDFKVYSDGTWDYEAVESEDTNGKYLDE